jgi:hypothetical protein
MATEFDFNWEEFVDTPLTNRYPEGREDVFGGAEWYNLCVNALEMDNFNLLIESFETLVRLPKSTHPAGLPSSTKRLFISHRQIDAQEAKRIAQIASTKGWAVWLDVEDPTLQSIPSGNDPRHAVIIAAIIEMALLNCTHVVALMTDNSQGSTWIPYEYGRVKARIPVSVNAASLISLSSQDLPEYMYLGVRLYKDNHFESWLDTV